MGAWARDATGEQLSQYQQKPSSEVNTSGLSNFHQNWLKVTKFC